jgi:hypothetical protein
VAPRWRTVQEFKACCPQPEITVHPRAAKQYARMVDRRQSNLAALTNAADTDSRDLINSIRSLVEKN